MMNDVTLKDYAALVVSEPYTFEMNGKILTSPMGHQGWKAVLPSERHDGRRVVRSILWVRRDIECEEVRVPSTDLTVILLRLPDRSVLLGSVHVEDGNVATFDATIDLRTQALQSVRRPTGPHLDIIVAGDFNRHHQLCGGDGVLSYQQGEADPIINFMSDWSLCSLLPRVIKTWENRRNASTIDLMLASAELATSVLTCKIHDTEHGSDHRAIETSFNIDLPDRITRPRLLFKNAPWNAIRELFAQALGDGPRYSKTPPGTRSGSVLLKRYRIDQQVVMSKRKPTVWCRWSLNRSTC